MQVSPVPIALIHSAWQNAQSYSQYALQRPDDIQLVALAMAPGMSRTVLAERHAIPPKRQFDDWQAFLDTPPLAEIVMIGPETPQKFEVIMHCLQSGYHVLLESPLHLSIAETQHLIYLAQEVRQTIFIDQWLMYTAFYRSVRDLLHSGRLGRILHVHHEHHLTPWQTSHRFIRAPYQPKHKADILLHDGVNDLALLLWLLQGSPAHISAVGTDRAFAVDDAPRGDVPERCTDDCPIESECAFSTLGIYLERRLPTVPDAGWPHTDLLAPNLVDTPPNIVTILESALWGKCVYHQARLLTTHTTVNAALDSGAQLSLLLDGHAEQNRRFTRVVGEYGTLRAEFNGPHSQIIFLNHATGQENAINMRLAPASEAHISGLLGYIIKAVSAGPSPSALMHQDMMAYWVGQAAVQASEAHHVVDFDAFLAREL
ncbi:MAG: Gfo/Idh/MocA family oxidoreductase [Anaerolineales bacterium]